MTLSELFTAVQAALPARRGNLYEQYLDRADFGRQATSIWALLRLDAVRGREDGL